MPANHSDLEKRLWDAADELRANSHLMSSAYSVPVLALIFLRYADHKFIEAEKKMPQQVSGRRKIGKSDYQAQGVLYLPEKARFSYLLNLPEGTDIVYGATTSARLPVSIAYTDQSDREAVEAALRAELAGGAPTGFEPSENEA